jgi:CheY-like chemotaxis protein
MTLAKTKSPLNFVDLPHFISFVSSKRADKDKWLFCAILPLTEAITANEIQQYISFHYKSSNAVITISDNSVFILAPRSEGVLVTHLEQGVYRDFGHGSVRVISRSISNGGLHQLGQLIEPFIKDNASRLSFKRMNRMSNVIMVVDDDPMLLKHMEKVLQGRGHIITMASIEEFEQSYNEYAPDILFLDIHIGLEMGNHILKKLREDIDPNAYVIMISSDTKQEIVIDLKKHRANGFVVKPIDKTRIYQHVQRAPTYMARTENIASIRN